MTEEYAKALEIANAASKKFSEAQKAYRSLKIGDAEFLAAKAEYHESEKAFDLAAAKEEALDEAEAQPEETASEIVQMQLFGQEA